MALRARKVSGAFEKQSPGRGPALLWVVVLDKSLYSHSASLHPGVRLGTEEINSKKQPSMQWTRIPNSPSHFMPLKTEIRAGLIGQSASYADL